MMWNGTQQAEEKATIKERKIMLELSDADCKRLSFLCGTHGLSISQLLENFIGDLVDGTYSNGSDERDLADQWFNRCWFGSSPEPTLLGHLLLYYDDVTPFLEIYDEYKNYLENPEEYAEELVELEKDEKLWFVEEYHDYVDEFLKANPAADMVKEVEMCLKWKEDSEKLLQDYEEAENITYKSR